MAVRATVLHWRRLDRSICDNQLEDNFQLPLNVMLTARLYQRSASSFCIENISFIGMMKKISIIPVYFLTIYFFGMAFNGKLDSEPFFLQVYAYSIYAFNYDAWFYPENLQVVKFFVMKNCSCTFAQFFLFLNSFGESFANASFSINSLFRTMISFYEFVIGHVNIYRRRLSA